MYIDIKIIEETSSEGKMKKVYGYTIQGEKGYQEEFDNWEEARKRFLEINSEKTM